MTEKDIERINELYHKKEAGTITPKELEEQAKLRKAYIEAFKRNMRGQLETITIQYPDGSKVKVKDRHDKKYGIKTH